MTLRGYQEALLSLIWIHNLLEYFYICLTHKLWEWNETGVLKVTGADRSPVWVERLVGTTHSVNQTPSPLVCLIISSRLGESMKTNTFVTRTAAATAHNSTIRAAHKAKNRKERPLQLAVSADSRQQEVYAADRNTRMRGATFLRETRAGVPLLVL